MPKCHHVIRFDAEGAAYCDAPARDLLCDTHREVMEVDPPSPLDTTAEG